MRLGRIHEGPNLPSVGVGTDDPDSVSEKALTIVLRNRGLRLGNLGLSECGGEYSSFPSLERILDLRCQYVQHSLCFQVLPLTYRDAYTLIRHYTMESSSPSIKN